MNPLIKLADVTKTYQMGEAEIHALANIDLEIKKGEFVSILGPSGSGKSTLMHIIGLLDRPSHGLAFLQGKSTQALTEPERADLRNKYIGFVFQTFNLLSRTSALENVTLPLIYAEIRLDEREKRALTLLKKLGLADRANHTPSQLSGGQQQRVAIARALINNPALILADEPTGNLDSKTGEEIIKIFKTLHTEGNTMVLVTHEKKLAKMGERIIELKDGRVVKDRIN